MRNLHLLTGIAKVLRLVCNVRELDRKTVPVSHRFETESQYRRCLPALRLVLAGVAACSRHQVAAVSNRECVTQATRGEGKRRVADALVRAFCATGCRLGWTIPLEHWPGKTVSIGVGFEAASHKSSVNCDSQACPSRLCLLLGRHEPTRFPGCSPNRRLRQSTATRARTHAARTDIARRLAADDGSQPTCRRPAPALGCPETHILGYGKTADNP